MITLNEKELQDIHRNKGIIKFEKMETAKANNNLLPVFNIFFNRMLTMLSDIKTIASSLFSRMDKLENKINTQQPSKVSVIKENPKQWNFEVVRDMEGKIKRIKATPV